MDYAHILLPLLRGERTG